MSEKRIFLSAPHLSGEEKKYVDDAFETNWIAPLGPNVNSFEKELAQYAGVKDAAVFNSGTAAIHLALQLLNVGNGDVVFCSSLTFAASANPILYQNAEPVFIDSEPDTWNMSPVALKRAFEEAEKQDRLPKAVIVVNLYGQSADMDEIVPLCERYGVPIIEDAAESLGASYKGKRSGTFGTYGIYSFNGNKIITTSGGGALISNDVESLKRARFLSTQARDPARHYQHSTTGYNYRLSNVLAGVGRGQLEVLDERVKGRRAVFNRYVEALSDVAGLTFMPEPEGYYSNRWLTVLTINPEEAGFTRDDVIDVLEEKNIEARPVWKPLHLQPLFEQFAYYKHTEKSVSDELFTNGICLPSGTNMSTADQEHVIEQFRSLVKTKVGI
ncbi:aminotransferase class I/II-fold pyridoxal phosphate-dependent enzyme [Bacillus tianshenii]|nr:aminotransferase class I/II-fold pyridoxal phosphate-dependent enzyme [Bacillus tianshenii]